MKQGKKYALNLLLIIIVTVFAVWFALKDNYEEVLRLISEMPWYFLLIIMAWGIIYTLVILPRRNRQLLRALSSTDD